MDFTFVCAIRFKGHTTPSNDYLFDLIQLLCFNIMRFKTMLNGFD